MGPVESLKGQQKGRGLMFLEHLLGPSAYVSIKSLALLSVGFIIPIL